MQKFTSFQLNYIGLRIIATAVVIIVAIIMLIVGGITYIAINSLDPNWDVIGYNWISAKICKPKRPHSYQLQARGASRNRSV